VPYGGSLLSGLPLLCVRTRALLGGMMGRALARPPLAASRLALRAAA